MWEPIFRIFPILVSSPLVSPPYPDLFDDDILKSSTEKI
jgi:hypothetical protein